MGENTQIFAPDVRHLLRRAGFGAPPREVQTILGLATTRGEAADYLLRFKPSKAKPAGRYIDGKINGWLKIMLKTKYPLQEKLTLFWHDHFATSNDKVGNEKSMAAQNALLRYHAAGDFRTFLKEINRNAAMIEFLDTNRNRAEEPNENYGRELQELFTLGVHDFAGNPNYDQADIVEVARAFTGWDYDYRSAKSYYDDNRHDRLVDWPLRGDKHIYKNRPGFGPSGGDITANGEGPQEIDTVVDLILQHQDTDGKNTVARRTCRRLFEYFVSGRFADASDPYVVSNVDAAITASGFGVGGVYDIKALVRAILVSDAFYYDNAGPLPASLTPVSIKMPVDLVISTLRLVQLKPKGKYFNIEGGSYDTVGSDLENMGQLPMYPPSVFGWDWETAWVSSSTLLARYAFVRDVSTARYSGGSTRLQLKKFLDTSLVDPGDIVDAVLDALGTSGLVTVAERDILIDYLTDDGARSTIPDMDGDYADNLKVRGLIALAMQSAAFQMH